ncbi:MAG: DMT family transporter [Muribaculaceae bacterium]|nr:DMT family transporter [Muribaculaceae bacterium]
MTLKSIKGYFLAALAAAAYGTNPAFAVPLYEQGMNVNTVLLFRYVLGIPLLALLMRIRKVPFSLEKGAMGQTALLGILMAVSSLTLFASYNYMNSGIASTLLFVYPVMVAVIMIFFYHEKNGPSLYICLFIMFAGLFLLVNPTEGIKLSPYGCLLVMLSALTYALYIVFVNVSKKIRAIPTTKLLFYVLIWGSLFFFFNITLGNGFTWPTRGLQWVNLSALAIIPTLLSLACTTAAIQMIGSTPTAILGSLEPVSAVLLSVFFLHQPITAMEIVGGGLIVVATIVVINDKKVDHTILFVRKMFPKHHLNSKSLLKKDSNQEPMRH